jgi:hypothetical protein
LFQREGFRFSSLFFTPVLFITLGFHHIVSEALLWLGKKEKNYMGMAF